jgi:hypothetical protein
VGEEGQVGHGQVLVALGDGEGDRPFSQPFGPAHGCNARPRRQPIVDFQEQLLGRIRIGFAEAVGVHRIVVG